jgi:hypothetical protein
MKLVIYFANPMTICAYSRWSVFHYLRLWCRIVINWRIKRFPSIKIAVNIYRFLATEICYDRLVIRRKHRQKDHWTKGFYLSHPHHFRFHWSCLISICNFIHCLLSFVSEHCCRNWWSDVVLHWGPDNQEAGGLAISYDVHPCNKCSEYCYPGDWGMALLHDK